MSVLPVPAAPGSVLVTEPGDTPQALESIRLRGGRDGSAVVVEPTPDIRGSFWVYRDLLRAMGAMPDVHRTERRASELRVQAVGRLAAWPVEHVVITRAHMCGTSLLEEWINAGADAGKAVWVVAHVELLNSKLTRLVEQVGMRVASFEEFLAEVPEPAPASQPRALTPRCPQVPRTEFPLFLATCDRLLDAADAARVRGLFDEARVEMTALIDGGMRAPDEVAEVLRASVRESTCTDEVIIRTRAAQAAAFSRGLHLKVRIETVVGSSEWAPRTQITDEIVDRLLEPPSNHHAAVAAIALITAAEGQAIAEIDVGDVTPDGSALVIRGERIDVPPALQRTIAAQRFTRLLQGADQRDGLFMNSERSTSRKAERVSGKGIQRLLVTSARASGLPLSAAWTSHERADAGNWATRTGVSIQEIPEAAA